MQQTFLANTIKHFHSYKKLGDKTFSQLKDEDLFFKPSPASNSIAVIVKHMHGNMLSRWTNFLTEDGEKDWRQRDAEFEEEATTKEQVVELWEKGWECLFNALQDMTFEDLDQTVTIRTEPMMAYDAILRQLAHLSSHIGQIVYIGKMIQDKNWQSLSIPKGESKQYLESVKAAQAK